VLLEAGVPAPLEEIMRKLALLTALLSLAAMALVPAAASASSKQLALFQDDRQLLLRGDAVRDSTLDELRALGVDAIKVELPWSVVAPKGKRKPSGFDPSNPAAYQWGSFDGVVAAAQARGFQVMFALSPPVPGWATRKSGDRVGVDRPKAKEFRRFAQAAGAHFPRVKLWTMWNEPNHPGFLFPQATRKRVPFAPRLYRALSQAGADGLRASGHTSDRILFGEFLPIGKARVFRRNTMKPILFLREMFCLNSHWRRYRGRAAKAHGCRHYKPLRGLNGFAYHPYTRPNGPRGKEPSRLDATIRSIRRVTRALDRARRRGRIRGGRLSVWNTEFGFQSRPPDPFQTRISRIPGFLGESEWISYRNRRIASYSQYTLVDTPVSRRGDLFGTWQGGLKFANRRKKQRVYQAYRLPLFLRQLGPSAVEVWGDARPGGPGAIVQVEQRLGRGRFSNLGRPITVSNVRGYFKARFRIRKASRRKFRFRSGGFTSRTAKAVVR
jgi:hypothetical protein